MKYYKTASEKTRSWTTVRYQLDNSTAVTSFIAEQFHALFSIRCMAEYEILLLHFNSVNRICDQVPNNVLLKSVYICTGACWVHRLSADQCAPGDWIRAQCVILDLAPTDTNKCQVLDYTRLRLCHIFVACVVIRCTCTVNESDKWISIMCD